MILVIDLGIPSVIFLSYIDLSQFDLSYTSRRTFDKAVVEGFVNISGGCLVSLVVM